MKITIKQLRTGETYDVEIEQSDSGKKLIEKVAEISKQPADSIKLVAGTKIVKETLTCEENRIYDGQTLQMTVSKKQQSIQPRETVLPDIKSQQQQGAPAPGGIGAGANMGNFASLMQNPQYLQQIMQDPLTQSIMGNPELMKNMMMNNPMTQELIKKNPEIAEAFEDPEQMKEMLNIMNNPAQMQEMLRQHDSQIMQLQGLPGGQELLNQFQQQLTDTDSKPNGQKEWFLPESNQDKQKQQQETKNINVEKTDPLPRSYLQSILGPKNKSQQPPAVIQNPFGAPASNFEMPLPPGMDMQQMQQLMNNPMINQQMEQMLENPETFARMMSNPMVRAQMEQMFGSDPLMSQMLNDPQQMRQFLQMSRQMNPGVQNSNSYGQPPQPQQNPNLTQEQYAQQAQQLQQRAAQRNQQLQQQFEQLRVKYASELEMIRSMGIQASDEEILQLLEVYGGNVEQVLNQLFDQGMN